MEHDRQGSETTLDIIQDMSYPIYRYLIRYRNLGFDQESLCGNRLPSDAPGEEHAGGDKRNLPHTVDQVSFSVR